MDLDIVFLGTSGSVPTARRGLAGTLVRRGGDRILFDCGEGTQRQLLRSTVGLVELPEIFVTHYHADHYLGLPGMLKTFALRGRDVPLTVYGPPGLVDLFSVLRRIFGKLTYDVDLVELRAGDAVERGDYRILADGKGWHLHLKVSGIRGSGIRDQGSGGSVANRNGHSEGVAVN